MTRVSDATLLVRLIEECTGRGWKVVLTVDGPRATVQIVRPDGADYEGDEWSLLESLKSAIAQASSEALG